MSDKSSMYMLISLLERAAKRLTPKKIRCALDQRVGWLEAEVLMAHALHKDRSWIIAHGKDFLAASLRTRFEKLILRRLSHEPVAYIIGHKDFYGRSFVVNRHVLIPRPETELFIEELKQHFKPMDRFTLWDVGTGSGVLACTVALEFPNASIIASDICKRALRVASINAKQHGIQTRIRFFQADLLEKKIRTECVSSIEPLIIVANLPYLRKEETLESDVVDFEPHKALFAGDDGLDLYRALFQQVQAHFTTNPTLLLAEFDPQQITEIKKIAKKHFPLHTIRTKKDLAKRHRLLIVSLT